jgi:hypothetical protein
MSDERGKEERVDDARYAELRSQIDAGEGGEAHEHQRRPTRAIDRGKAAIHRFVGVDHGLIDDAEAVGVLRLQGCPASSLSDPSVEVFITPHSRFPGYVFHR